LFRDLISNRSFVEKQSEKKRFGKDFPQKHPISEHFYLFKSPLVGFTWEQWRFVRVSI
jgi:hypothetical protein